MKINSKYGTYYANNIQKFVFLLVIVNCFSISGCEKNPGIVWAANAKSPTGAWVAEAKTKQWGGPGNDYVSTSVTLIWTLNSRRPHIEVLEFSDESAYPIGTTSVKMKWLTNSHLDVSYNAEAKVDFQAIKASGVEITANQSSEISLK